LITPNNHGPVKVLVNDPAAPAGPYKLDLRGIRLGMTLDEVMAGLPSATVKPHERRFYDRNSPSVVAGYSVVRQGNTATVSEFFTLALD
jgi:hypothetical protein